MRLHWSLRGLGAVSLITTITVHAEAGQCDGAARSIDPDTFVVSSCTDEGDTGATAVALVSEVAGEDPRAPEAVPVGIAVIVTEPEQARTWSVLGVGLDANGNAIESCKLLLTGAAMAGVHSDPSCADIAAVQVTAEFFR